jgi:hypothetical protein
VGTSHGHDVVISALGRGNSFKSSNVISRSMRTIVPAMERQIFGRPCRSYPCRRGTSRPRPVSRADVADFILTQLDDRSYVRKVVVISY